MTRNFPSDLSIGRMQLARRWSDLPSQGTKIWPFKCRIAVSYVRWLHKLTLWSWSTNTREKSGGSIGGSVLTCPSYWITFWSSWRSSRWRSSSHRFRSCFDEINNFARPLQWKKFYKRKWASICFWHGSAIQFDINTLDVMLASFLGPHGNYQSIGFNSFSAGICVDQSNFTDICISKYFLFSCRIWPSLLVTGGVYIFSP